jgi:hypothetical protein
MGRPDYWHNYGYVQHNRRRYKEAIREDRDLAKIAQSFAQEKSAAKSRQETPAPKAAAAVTTPVAKPATATASNGAKETTTMSALKQLVGLIGKDGTKKLVDSL